MNLSGYYFTSLLKITIYFVFDPYCAFQSNINNASCSLLFNKNWSNNVPIYIYSASLLSVIILCVLYVDILKFVDQIAFLLYWTILFFPPPCLILNDGGFLLCVCLFKVHSWLLSSAHYFLCFFIAVILSTVLHIEMLPTYCPHLFFFPSDL